MSSPEKHLRVAIVGASDNPSRYAYLALQMLEESGFPTTLVSPRITAVEHRPVHPTLEAIPESDRPIDTVTLYVGAGISSALEASLLTLNPRRVIFNPGAENPTLAATLRRSGIATLDACTLVLLRTGRF